MDARPGWALDTRKYFAPVPEGSDACHLYAEPRIRFKVTATIPMLIWPSSGSRLAVLLTALACVTPGGPTAQAPGTTPPAVTLIEAKGTADGMVAFQINAPRAQQVSVLVDTMPVARAKAITKDPRGIWSGTLGPRTAEKNTEVR